MRKIVIIICLLIFSVATLASIFATTDDGERVILHEDGTWEYFRPPESNDEVDLNDYDREYEIGNLEITVHSVERLNDFLIVDVSVVNNYPFGIWLMQDYFFLLYGRTKSPLILEESNIGQKYMNALLTEKYGTYLSAYGKIRGYLVFSVKGNMQSQKLLIDIPEEDNDIEDIWGEHVLDITGVKAPIFYERIDYPLKFLGVEITYHNYSDCLFVRVQNTSNKTVRAYKLYAKFFDDFGRKVDTYYSFYISQKLNMKPWETESAYWTLYNSTITRAEVEVVEVVFADGTKW